ncbi:MAG: toxic anion resistance protein [Gammaproteobacteria bacterium]
MSDNQQPTVDQSATTVVGGELREAVASLPQIKDEMVVYQSASSEQKEKIDALMTELNVRDSNSIIFFGAKAQENLTTISDNMLEDVRNKDIGGAGTALNNMVATLRGFDTDGLQKPGFFARLFGKASHIVKFLQRYETVQKQIDKISNELDGHKTQLLTDITSLDRLYTANLEYFHELELYIAAGDEKLRDLDNTVLPAQRAEAEGSDDVVKAQELRDLQSARDDLERRVHDLRLTRQVTMQGLPSIRIVQENDKGLVNKINSTMTNTIPLWRQQLAVAVTIARSQQAGKAVKSATDLTNELLRDNAETLNQSNAETRRQIERGVFDIEAVKEANEKLISTIEESLQIADEGKRMRADAVQELQVMEDELKKTLVSASAERNGA